MNLNKPLLITGAVASIGMATVATAGIAMAETAQNGPGAQNTLVQKIAEKFNLNQGEVQAVFDQEREVRHEQREKQFEDRLNTAVSEGKLTEDQKAKILAKHEEMEAEMEKTRGDMASKTPEERRTTMETRRAEIQKWAEENNIPTDYLMMGAGKGSHGGGGGGFRGMH